MSRPESGPGPDKPPHLSSLDALLALGPTETPSERDGDGSLPSDGAGGGGDEAGPAGGLGELREVDVEAVVPNEYQPRRRFEEESLAALTESVRELGVLQPILVRPAGPDEYELIAGERRWRAARQAGLRRIPAIIRSTDDVSSLEQAIVENLHRQDLNALEEAAAYQQLVDDFGLTQDEVATRVGKSRSAVSNTLRLFQLPAVVQRLVSDGSLSAGHARAVLSVADPTAQRNLAERIVAEDLSVRAAEDAAKALDSGAEGSTGRSTKGSSRRPTSAAALEVERLLEERLETRVEVSEAGGNGRITIRFADRDDLERIFRLLSE
ncbi:MAG: ParB/RepB/Spo0J family partition protein [Actinomycetota bacterium]